MGPPAELKAALESFGHGAGGGKPARAVHDQGVRRGGHACCDQSESVLLLVLELYCVCCFVYRVCKLVYVCVPFFVLLVLVTRRTLSLGGGEAASRWPTRRRRRRKGARLARRTDTSSTASRCGG